MSRKLITVLKDTANQVETTAALLVQKTSDWQTIKRYMTSRTSDIKLTDVQKEKMKRYQFIYNQIISNKYTESEVINTVVKLYDIEQRQAYEDLDDTRELFTTLLNINKAFELKVELESAKSLKRLCVAKGDLPSAAKFSKNIIQILALINQEETMPEGVFEGHAIEAVFDPKLIGAPEISEEQMKALLQKINLKRNKQISIEDIGFEEVLK
jgi:hypothetical protein